MAKVCIDAGHYGKYNRSPVVREYYESIRMWKLHELLVAELKTYGIDVVVTRTDQTKDLDLIERGKKAKGCDLFISLHSNACDTASVDRVVAIYLVPDADTTHDEKSKPIAEKLAAVVTEVMGTNDKAKVTTRLASGDRDGDGKRDDNYYGVLHGADSVNVPGVILEHSFHTNKKAAEWLLIDANLEKLAVAEADCIAEWLGVSKPLPAVLYRVQTGAYALKKNADAQLKKVKAAGFNTYMVKSGLLYKIQIGAYSKRKNAEAMLAKVKKAGFSAYITTKSGKGV